MLDPDPPAPPLGADAYHGVTTKSPDFATLARGYGCAAWTVRETAEFAPAFRAALAHDGPALIHVLTDIRDGSASGPLQR
jgi:acetolactate synthase-1/2/3 large subunit